MLFLDCVTPCRVLRDIEGTSFNSHAPFIHHLPSRKRFEAGLPIPVHCCWDGMAVLNAAPFTKHGLRFRGGEALDGIGDVNQVCVWYDKVLSCMCWLLLLWAGSGAHSTEHSRTSPPTHACTQFLQCCVAIGQYMTITASLMFNLTFVDVGHNKMNVTSCYLPYDRFLPLSEVRNFAATYEVHHDSLLHVCTDRVRAVPLFRVFTCVRRL